MGSYFPLSLAEWQAVEEGVIPSLSEAYKHSAARPIQR
jgi:hypothetical protein